MVGGVAGWALVAWAVRGVLRHGVDTRPAELARFLAGVLVSHDVVLVPIVLLAGWGVARVARGPGRAAVQAALVVSGCLALFAFPLFRGYGRALGNPTSLPHDYGANLLVVLGAVWVVAGAAVVASRASARARGRRAQPPA